MRLNDIYKLSNLVRYNNKTRIKSENVAEHSFYVAILSLLICDKYNLDNSIKQKCLIKAILHDMPEIELNDITHDVKEKLNLDIYLSKFEKKFYNKNFKNYTNLMCNYTPVVTEVVNLADILSVKQFTDNELMLGNKSKDIYYIKKDTDKRISEEYRKLLKLLEEKK